MIELIDRLVYHNAIDFFKAIVLLLFLCVMPEVVLNDVYSLALFHA